MKINKNSIRKIIEKITLGITVLLIVIIVYLITSNIRGKVPFIFDKAILNIVTGSMEPIIPTDTYILIEKISPDQIKEGDIITFYSRDQKIYGKLNTHQVIEVIGEGENIKFRTKGTNKNTNALPDETLVEGEDVIGIYQKNLPILSKLTDFMSKKAVFFLLIIIPILSIISVQIKEIVEKSRQIKIEKLIQIEIEKLKNDDNIDQ